MALTQVQSDTLAMMQSMDDAGEIYGIRILAKRLDIEAEAARCRVKALMYLGKVEFGGYPKTYRVRHV